MLRIAPAVALAAAAACAAPPRAPAAAPPAPAPAAAADSGVLAIQQGGSDVFVETFTRTAGRLETRLTAMGINLATEAALGPDATVSRLVVRQYAGAADTLPAQTLTAEFRGDSVIAEVVGVGPAPQTVRQAVGAGAVAFVNPSPAMMEQIVRRAREIGGDTVQVPVWVVAAGGQPARAAVVFSPGGATLMLGPVEVRLTLDERGRITAGTIPQQGLEIVRREAGEGPPPGRGIEPDGR